MAVHHTHSQAGSRLAVKAALESIKQALNESDSDEDYKSFASEIYGNILSLWEEHVLADGLTHSNTNTATEIPTF